MNRLPYAARKIFFNAVGIKLSAEQEEASSHDDRFPVIGGGERGGKSWWTAVEMAAHIYMLPRIRPDVFFTKTGELLFDEVNDKPRNAHFVLFGPTYAEPRWEFKYIEDFLRSIGQLAGGINKPSKPAEGAWRLVTKSGVVLQTWSMEDPGSVRSLDLEGAAICEAGRCQYSGVERVQGRVSAKKGFIIYSGTMEDSQQWYQDWMLMGQRENHLGIVSYSLPTFSNLHEFPGGRNDPEILRLEGIYPDDIFAMRVLAEPRPPRSRVLKELGKEHIQTMKVTPEMAVEVWIDPGYQSAYAVLFVAIWDEFTKKPRGAGDDWKPELLGKHFHVFDELYEQGLTTNDIISLCKKNRYWPRVKQGIIDIAGKGHRDAGESALEIWKKKTSLNWNMKYWREDPLIERIRSSAKQNRITIDPKCVGLIAEAGLGEPVFDNMHPWKYLLTRDGTIAGEKPIDKWNHSAKALGYGLLHHLGQVEHLRKPTNINRLKKKAPLGRVLGKTSRRFLH
jgi:hypothetical protein